MILIISGSRSIDDPEIFRTAMHEFAKSVSVTGDGTYPLPLNKWINYIVSGNARGVDAVGEAFAKKQNIDLISMPANWGKHGKAAGPMRNEELARVASGLSLAWPGTYGPVHLLAIPFPGVSHGGTRHMINYCQSIQIPTFIYDASSHTRWPELQAKLARESSQGK